MENIRWELYKITKEDRQKLHGHRSFVIWFTGLPSSGKSTLANSVETVLHQHHISTYTLDGDNVRNGLNAGLGFTDWDRKENIRRVSEVAKLFVDAGIVVLVAAISPAKEDRSCARGKFNATEFVEVFVDCPVQVCAARDVKGLYRKAQAGEIHDFTGVSAPYEAPENPELHLRTDESTIAQCRDVIIDYLSHPLGLDTHSSQDGEEKLFQ